MNTKPYFGWAATNAEEAQRYVEVICSRCSRRHTRYGGDRLHFDDPLFCTMCSLQRLWQFRCTGSAAFYA